MYVHACACEGGECMEIMFMQFYAKQLCRLNWVCLCGEFATSSRVLLLPWTHTLACQSNILITVWLNSVKCFVNNSRFIFTELEE